MANSNKKFGEAFFAELNDDTYLHKIYEDILFNYSIKVFSFKKRAKRHIPKIDALTFADLLSKSNHSTLADSQKMWAQEIVTMLHYLYPDDPTVTYMRSTSSQSTGLMHHITKTCILPRYGSSMRLWCRYILDRLNPRLKTT